MKRFGIKIEDWVKKIKNFEKKKMQAGERVNRDDYVIIVQKIPRRLRIVKLDSKEAINTPAIISGDGSGSFRMYGYRVAEALDNEHTIYPVRRILVETQDKERIAMLVESKENDPNGVFGPKLNIGVIDDNDICIVHGDLSKVIQLGVYESKSRARQIVDELNVVRYSIYGGQAKGRYNDDRAPYERFCSYNSAFSFIKNADNVTLREDNTIVYEMPKE